MQIVLKKQAIQRKNSDVCVATEYKINDETLDFAIIKITGRYPAKQRAVNIKCKEIIYVNSGNGKVVVNKKEYSLNAGDLVLIEAGEKFFWEGNLELFISCTPAFTVEQHQLTE